MTKPNPLPIRMAAVDPPSPLTDNGIKLLAKFADTYAQVTEMTPGATCLHEFARSAEFCFGEDNWRRVLEHAPKFRDAESEEDGTTGSEDKVVMDPGIATMSLRQSVDRLAKLGQCTSEEAAQQAQRLNSAVERMTTRTRAGIAGTIACQLASGTPSRHVFTIQTTAQQANQ